MKNTLAGLRAFLGLDATVAHGRTRPDAGRNVMLRVTLDALHAMPLRQALIRDCADQPWTIRVALLHGTGRVRLSLYLPKAAVKGAMQRVADLAPTAEFGQLLEVPDAPTGAWQDLMHPESPSRIDSRGQRHDTRVPADALARLISKDHVLLGLDVASRRALFAKLGDFVEQRYGLPATAVTRGLEAREALGSTGLGQGVAVPHGQIGGLHGALVLYVRPALPIPFDAPDGKPVSDVIVLLVPEWANTTHLHLLADVAQRFCDYHFREQLHGCTEAESVCRLFADYEAQDAAARNGPHTALAGRPLAVVKSLRPHG
jgi:PTS system nitrogen regulatory IIA component